MLCGPSTPYEKNSRTATMMATFVANLLPIVCFIEAPAPCPEIPDQPAETFSSLPLTRPHRQRGNGLISWVLTVYRTVQKSCLLLRSAAGESPFWTTAAPKGIP